MIPSSNNAIASQKFPDYLDCVMQAADDFVVTGSGGSINRVNVIGTSLIGFVTPSIPPTNCVEVYIYANNAGLPGTFVYTGTSLA